MQNFNQIMSEINIMLVDDMESMRGIIKAYLRNLGAENITLAFHGEEAWTKMQSKRIDLIVCDWDMPKMTGLQLLQKVRDSEDHQHIPFLLLTASQEKERVLAAIKAGVNDYLCKPFQPKELEYKLIKLMPKVKLKK